MAWEWSHTQEAYDNARDNLESLSLESLHIIWAEIKSYQNDDKWNWERFYNDNLDLAKRLSYNCLLDDIWDYMDNFRTCDNGGFNAWCCPYGCHTVSFDLVKG